ncbi:interferon-induced transmembrane protein 3-like, partial [Poecilia reticulata]|uniref:interferon-induced transmembrane protein 3-like n=1 Tax=Poecilia reticulata TaxID=8081 RepID=UPI0007E98429
MATAPPDNHQPVVVALPQYVCPEVHTQPHMMVHQSAVNIPAVQPSDDIIWSLACFMYGNPLCLGLAALIFSVKARDRKVVGD